MIAARERERLHRYSLSLGAVWSRQRLSQSIQVGTTSVRAQNACAALENVNSSLCICSVREQGPETRRHVAVVGRRDEALTIGVYQGNFQMRELKRRIPNYSVTVVLALVLWPAVLAIASIAQAQSKAGIQSNPTSGPTPSPALKGTAQAPSDQSILAFSEDFSTPTAFSERFDHGWSGEWNAGSMFREERNDWHADHGMMCENPNTSHRTIHLT